MPDFEELFGEAIERIGTATGDAADAASHSVTETAEVARGAVQHLTGTDEDSARLLKGRALDGTTTSFDPAQVRSVVLRGADGEPIGVAFPTQVRLADQVHIEAWASNDLGRTADVQVTPRRPNLKHPDWITDQPVERAPWADSVEYSGRPPTYVRAHSNRNRFAVDLNLPGQDKAVTVGIDGETFGRVLEANQNFARANQANPGGPLVLICCESGKPDGTAARDVANYLHRNNVVTGDIYAPVDLVATQYSADEDPSGLSAVGGRDESGTPTPLFVKISPHDLSTPWDGRNG